MADMSEANRLIGKLACECTWNSYSDLEALVERNVILTSHWESAKYTATSRILHDIHAC